MHFKHIDTRTTTATSIDDEVFVCVVHEFKFGIYEASVAIYGKVACTYSFSNVFLIVNFTHRVSRTNSIFFTFVVTKDEHGGYVVTRDTQTSVNELSSIITKSQNIKTYGDIILHILNVDFNKALKEYNLSYF